MGLRRRNSMSGGFKIICAILLLVGIVGALEFSGCGQSSQESPVLAIVNGKSITLGEFDFRWSNLSESSKHRYQGESGKQKFLDELISQELLMQEAKKLGLEYSPEIRRRIQRFKEDLLLKEVMQEAVRAKVEITELELETHYQQHGAVLPAPDRIDVSIIVSNNIYASKDIKRMLNGGTDFSNLAKLYSTDGRTKKQGGLLGLYKKGMVPKLPAEVEAFINKARSGWTSEPIKTDAGYYLVRINSRKPGDTKSILLARERLKQEIYAQKRQQQIQNFLSQIKTTASIRIAESSKYMMEKSKSQPVEASPQ